MTTPNSEPQAPKIEFPCADYPIKVIGYSIDGFQDLVIDIVQQFAPDLDLAKVDTQASRNGKFLSVRLKINATSEQQLKQLHSTLMATGKVQMVI